jgi:hypothetical protein
MSKLTIKPAQYDPREDLAAYMTILDCVACTAAPKLRDGVGKSRWLVKIRLLELSGLLLRDYELGLVPRQLRDILDALGFEIDGAVVLVFRQNLLQAASDLGYHNKLLEGLED